MASKGMICDSLEEFAYNFNKGREYLNVMEGRWLAAFQNTPDECLTKGLQDVLTRHHQYPPSLGHVVEAVQKQVADLLGRVGSGITVKSYNFCQNCAARQGIIETAAHYIRDNKYVVSCKANLCGCPGSKEFNGTSLRLWNKRRELLYSDDRIEMKAFYYTDEHHPYLKGVDSNGQLFDHTVDPLVFHQRLDTIEKRKNGTLPSTSFSRAVDVLATASPEQLANLFQEEMDQ